MASLFIVMLLGLLPGSLGFTKRLRIFEFFAVRAKIVQVAAED